MKLDLTDPQIQAELPQVAAMVAFDRAIEARRTRYPYEWYDPSPGQLAFHRAPHAIRALFPGNGWGKTRAAGEECNAWARHLNAWQPTSPWPLLMLWFCKLSDQFELVREDLQSECFGTDVRWKQDGTFTWPDGSRLFLGLADRPEDWQRWQGVPVDLVVFDELPPLKLWREMAQRRRARRKTRYVIAATATLSEAWAETELYLPWRQFHEDRGMDERRAMQAQLHPEIFCWPEGGIADNPAADPEDVRWYETRTWSHPKEKKVRLHGGFESWVGDGVFDADALEWMRAQAAALDRTHPGRAGWPVPDLRPVPAAPRPAPMVVRR